jgi:ABC-2 type transport system ATP-binding protein
MVRAEPSDQASDLLTKMLGPAAVAREDGYFHLKTDPSRSLEINRQLMTAGIGVSELRPFERSLEEVFFQLTGEKQGS